MQRVVLDTNVFVSAFLTPTGVAGQIYDSWRRRDFALVLSLYILDEFTRVFREKMQFSAASVLEKVRILHRLAIIVDPASIDVEHVPENDRPILGTAVAGYAQAIVTGDRALFSLRQYHGIQIITPRTFLTMLHQEEEV